MHMLINRVSKLDMLLTLKWRNIKHVEKKSWHINELQTMAIRWRLTVVFVCQIFVLQKVFYLRGWYTAVNIHLFSRFLFLYFIFLWDQTCVFIHCLGIILVIFALACVKYFKWIRRKQAISASAWLLLGMH